MESAKTVFQYKLVVKQGQAAGAGWICPALQCCLCTMAFFRIRNRCMVVNERLPVYVSAISFSSIISGF
jgi:hypothetical protein